MHPTLPRRRNAVSSMMDAAKEHASLRREIEVEADIKRQCEEAVEAALDDPAFQIDCGLAL